MHIIYYRYLFLLCLYSNSPMSSMNHPKNRGQKTVFFHSFFAPKPTSNHHMLWSSSTFCPPNHNTSSELYSQRVLRWIHSCQEILAQMLLSKIPSVETYPQRAFVCENISVKVWIYYIAPLIQFLGKNASQTLSPIQT